MKNKIQTREEIVELFNEWLDGAKIQYRNIDEGGKWVNTRNPAWNLRDYEYRIAPDTPEEKILAILRDNQPNQEDGQTDWQNGFDAGYASAIDIVKKECDL